MEGTSIFGMIPEWSFSSKYLNIAIGTTRNSITKLTKIQRSQHDNQQQRRRRRGCVGETPKYHHLFLYQTRPYVCLGRSRFDTRGEEGRAITTATTTTTTTTTTRSDMQMMTKKMKTNSKKKNRGQSYLMWIHDNIFLDPINDPLNYNFLVNWDYK